MRIFIGLVFLSAVVLIIFLTWNAYSVVPDPGCYGPRPGQFQEPNGLRSIHLAFFSFLIGICLSLPAIRWFAGWLDGRSDRFRRIARPVAYVVLSAFWILAIVVGWVLLNACLFETFGGCAGLGGSSADQNSTKLYVYVSLLLAFDMWWPQILCFLGPIAAVFTHVLLIPPWDAKSLQSDAAARL